MSDRLTIATINLQSYRDNLVAIRALLPNTTKIMAIVKANAYGHGIAKIGLTAVESGAEYLGVVSLGELKQLRRAKIDTPILVINYLDANSLTEAVRLDSSISVMDENIIKMLEVQAARLAKRVKVHLKVDTGMHRAGCNPNDVTTLATLINSYEHLEFEGIFTHFAESEDKNIDFTQKQLAIFTECLDELRANDLLPPLIHCANSAAILTLPEAHFTMVRPGLVSYGLNPFSQEHPKHSYVMDHFKPVMSLKTQVAFIRTIEPGESVGYNRRWTAKRQSTIALLPVGYGDGYRRTPHNAGKVIIAEDYAPIIGSVAMDQTIVDITDIGAEVQVGDEVVLLGKQGKATFSADNIAEAYETTNYEVVTAIADRVERQYK